MAKLIIDSAFLTDVKSYVLVAFKATVKKVYQQNSGLIIVVMADIKTKRVFSRFVGIKKVLKFSPKKIYPCL